MASRKDLLKAYGFTSQRLVKALVDRRPDEVQNPLRRVVMGTFASVMVGVLAVGVFALIGFLNPGSSTKWKANDAVIVDKSSGGVFVYMGEQLYRAVNITSALLATNGGKVVTVSSRSLSGTPVAGTIGIPDAPAQLPAKSSMKGYPVQLCSAVSAGQRVTTIQIGQSSAAPEASPPSAVFAFSDARQTPYLVIDGVAHRTTRAVLTALGFPQVITPGTAFVTAFEQGTAIVAPALADLGGHAATSVAGHDVIGTILRPDLQSQDAYVLRKEGVVPISGALAVALRTAHPKLPDVTVAAASLTAARNDDPALSLMAGDLPVGTPKPVGVPSELSSASICATWRGGAHPQVTFGNTPPAATPQANRQVADAVFMPAITGALLRASDQADSQIRYLVTDGKAYGIADEQACTALGYCGSKPVSPITLPSKVIALLPQGLPGGGVLSTAAALAPV